MKRFTETNKWTGDPWFRKLPPRLKCLWLLMLDCCDAAGVIDLDWDLMSFQIGEDVGESDLPKLGERIERLPSGKFFLTKFIPFQYGELSPACKPHVPVFKSLHSNGINLERVSKGYPKASQAFEEEDKDQEKDKDHDPVDGTSTEKPPAAYGAICTLEQALSYAETVRFSPEQAAHWWHVRNASGWTKGSTGGGAARKITSWQSDMASSSWVGESLAKAKTGTAVAGNELRRRAWE